MLKERAPPPKESVSAGLAGRNAPGDATVARGPLHWHGGGAELEQLLSTQLAYAAAMYEYEVGYLRRVLKESPGGGLPV